jgi:hypothetical protein
MLLLLLIIATEARNREFYSVIRVPIYLHPTGSSGGKGVIAPTGELVSFNRKQTNTFPCFRGILVVQP